MVRLRDLFVPAVAALLALAACNALVGVDEVVTKKSKDGGTSDPGSNPGTDPGTPGGEPGTPGTTNDGGGPLTSSLAIAAGHNNTCARKADGTVACWGDNSAGQLGVDPTATPKVFSPTLVPGLTGVTQTCGGDSFTCALKTGGQVVCLGKNDFGQLGNGTSGASSTTPVVVSLTGAAKEIACGYAFACAVVGNGDVQCWGRNRYRELGSTTSQETNGTPIAVPGLAGVKHVSAGWYHTCAVASSGLLTCWGANDSGQAGHASNSQPVAGCSTCVGPDSVAGIANVDVVASGNDFTCARAGAVITCFGRNEVGQLGNGMTAASSPTATTVMGLSDPGFLALGSRHACVARTSGRVSCWGGGSDGSLGSGAGDGGGSASPVPVTVLSLTNAAAVAAGAEHSCAVTASNEVYCWGTANYGELGDGTTAAKTAFIPQKVQL